MLEDKVLNQLNCEVAKAKLYVSLILNKCVDCESELYDLCDNLYTMPKRWTRKIAALRLEIESKKIKLEQCWQEHNDAVSTLAIAQTALDEYKALTPIEQTKANLCSQLMVLSEIRDDYNQYDELSDTAQHELSCIEQEISNIKIQIERLSNNLNCVKEVKTVSEYNAIAQCFSDFIESEQFKQILIDQYNEQVQYYLYLLPTNISTYYWCLFKNGSLDGICLKLPSLKPEDFTDYYREGKTIDCVVTQSQYKKLSNAFDDLFDLIEIK